MERPAERRFPFREMFKFWRDLEDSTPPDGRFSGPTSVALILKGAIAHLEQMLSTNPMTPEEWNSEAVSASLLACCFLKIISLNTAAISSAEGVETVTKVATIFLAPCRNAERLNLAMAKANGVRILRLICWEQLEFLARKRIFALFKDVLLLETVKFHRRALGIQVLVDRLASMFGTCADVDFQQYIAETLTCFSVQCTENPPGAIEISQLRHFFRKSPEIAEATSVIDLKYLDATLREFVIAANESLPLTSRVFSLKCLEAHANDTNLRKPEQFPNMWLNLSPRTGNIQLVFSSASGGLVKISIDDGMLDAIETGVMRRTSSPVGGTDEIKITFKLVDPGIAVPFEPLDLSAVTLTVVCEEDGLFGQAEEHFFVNVYGHKYQKQSEFEDAEVSANCQNSSEADSSVNLSPVARSIIDLTSDSSDELVSVEGESTTDPQPIDLTMPTDTPPDDDEDSRSSQEISITKHQLSDLTVPTGMPTGDVEDSRLSQGRSTSDPQPSDSTMLTDDEDSRSSYGTCTTDPKLSELTMPTAMPPDDDEDSRSSQENSITKHQLSDLTVPTGMPIGDVKDSRLSHGRSTSGPQPSDSTMLTDDEDSRSSYGTCTTDPKLSELTMPTAMPPDDDEDSRSSQENSITNPQLSDSTVPTGMPTGDIEDSRLSQGRSASEPQLSDSDDEDSRSSQRTCTTDTQLIDSTMLTKNEDSRSSQGTCTTDTQLIDSTMPTDNVEVSRSTQRKSASHPQLRTLATTDRTAPRRPVKHKGKKPYHCEFCPYRCADQSSLRKHVMTHTGERPYRCNVCNFSATHSGHLNAHMRIHTKERPYTCDQCTYKCKQSSNLKAHMRIHTGEKPFECNMCRYAGSRAHSLTKHMRIHTGEKPYACDLCDYASRQPSCLKRHKSKCVPKSKEPV